MPNLKAKSDENYESAQLLIDNKKYTASVHCAYYSSFQLSKYILNHFCAIPYEVQNSNTSGKASHKYIKDSVVNYLRNNNEPIKLSLDYSQNFSFLKRMRKKADYDPIFISQNEAQKVIQAADNIDQIFAKVYKITK